MASAAQIAASRRHRERADARGIVRLEVRAHRDDAKLIRELAETLRGDQVRADRVRSQLHETLGDDEVRNAFDIFGSDEPDEVFEGVFEHGRERDEREIDL